MKKIILLLLLTTTFTTHLICMDAEQRELTLWKQIDAPIQRKIIFDFFISSLNSTDTPQVARDHMKNMIRVNKELCAFVNRPDITRTIIGNVSNHCNQHYVAQIIGTAGAQNYIMRSECFYNFDRKDYTSSVAQLIEQGADINYYPINGQSIRECNWSSACHDESPHNILRGVVHSYREAHVPPLMAVRRKQGEIYTPLHLAIRAQNIPIIELILLHKPRIKCVLDAVNTRNPEIIELILQQEDIPLDEARKGLNIATIQEDHSAIKLFETFFHNLMVKHSTDLTT
jgi:hypothetical protein